MKEMSVMATFRYLFEKMLINHCYNSFLEREFKDQLDKSIFDVAFEALAYKYKYENERNQQHQKFVNILASAANKN